jgi:chlorophyll synthase
MSAAFPDRHIVILAALYSAGAYGIMTLNDFKAVEGDVRMGIRSLPVVLGVDRAARLACIAMVLPQIAVMCLLWRWGAPIFATIIGLSVLAQAGLMIRLLGNPRKFAPWYNATGTTLYVLGMLVAAFALRPIVESLS